MIDDKKARGMMAADMAHRAAIALTGGDMYSACLRVAADILDSRALDNEASYRFALGCYGSTPEQIDAAVAAIDRGKWPADSITGRVLKMRDEAASRVTNEDIMMDATGEAKRDAFDAVLALLGVKP